MEPLDRIAETLAVHQVNFVVIGNYGAQLRGVEVQTQDADMAFQRERQNLERLMAALADLDAAIWFEGGTVRLPTHDPQLLAQGEIWNLRTAYGDLDLLYSPAGGGYEELLPNAEWVTPLSSGAGCIPGRHHPLARSKAPSGWGTSNAGAARGVVLPDRWKGCLATLCKSE